MDEAASLNASEVAEHDSLTLRAALIWFTVVLSIGLLMFWYHHLAVLAEGGSRTFLRPLITELSAAFGAGVLFLGVRALVRRHPLERATAFRWLPLYLAGLLLYSALHTSSNWALRSLLFPLAGLGRYDYGIMPLRYLMELPIDVIGFTLMVAALHAFRRLRAARRRELAAARLEGALARTRLRNLELQLQPHFLFNALNTVSAVMYDDPEAADEILDGLGELLRASLRSNNGGAVPLTVELDLLEAYLRIVRARFGDRVAVELSVDPRLEGVRIPPLLLQPLVENAVRHGGAEGRGHVRVGVAVRDRGGVVELEVTDDGPGAPAGIDPLTAGLGLSTTAKRLRLIFGAAAVLEAGNRPAGGFGVRVEIPLREAS